MTALVAAGAGMSYAAVLAKEAAAPGTVAAADAGCEELALGECLGMRVRVLGPVALVLMAAGLGSRNWPAEVYRM